MSIATEIERIKTNIADAYVACEQKGATLPSVKNSANLADSISSITGGSATTYKNMTVVIDTTNSDPEACCTYTNDAVNMIVGSEDWDVFFGHRPCLFKNGKVVEYLDKNDFGKDVNGNSVDIISGESGDVMIEFPLRGLTIRNIGTNKIEVTMSDNPNLMPSQYLGHTRGAEIKNSFYLGAYLDSVVDNKIRSLSGKTIDNTGISMNAMRTLCQANRAEDYIGYDMMAYYQLVYVQAMYLLKYKSLNSQTAVGRGVCNATSGVGSGNTDNKGMDYGSTSDTEQVKLFGLEDAWGNYLCWIDGIVLLKDATIAIGTDSFNSNGTGYINYGSNPLGVAAGVTKEGYTSDVVGTTEVGFLASKNAGTESTYWCDNTTFFPYREEIRGMLQGGRWTYGSKCGLFNMHMDNTPSYSNYSHLQSCRLMYL